MYYKYTEVELDHMVDFPKDDCTFATGREAESGKTRIFLIFNHNGSIYSRNGRVNSWEALSAKEAAAIRHSAEHAREQGLPCYICNNSIADQISSVN